MRLTMLPTATSSASREFERYLLEVWREGTLDMLDAEVLRARFPEFVLRDGVCGMTRAFAVSLGVDARLLPATPFADIGEIPWTRCIAVDGVETS